MRVLPIIMLLFLVTACQKVVDTDLEIDTSVKQIVFFSDESRSADFHIEGPYYDAIIELRQQFPEEFRRMKIVEPSKANNETFKVNECPALIVVQNEKVIVKITGENTKEEIVQPISAALTN